MKTLLSKIAIHFSLSPFLLIFFSLNARKKICSLLPAFFIGLSVLGQTYLSEDFSSGQMPPPGWTIAGFAQQFTCAQSDNAGGIAPECRINGFAFNGTLRMVSPVIDMTGISQVTLLFRHFYDYKNIPSPTIGIATKSSGSWNTVWELTPSSDAGPDEIQVVIDNVDMNNPDFQLSVYVTGAISNMTSWYIDNILLLVPVNLDAQISSISVPVTITSASEVAGEIQNLGMTNITNFNVAFQDYNGMIFDTTYTGLNLGTFESHDFTFDRMWVQPFGTYDLTMWINSVNGVSDDYPANDTATKSITYLANILPQRVVFEEFTSSTCGPCAAFNSSFNAWCGTHPDITLVKYQMDWPGAGDPYYTEEGGIRHDYYNVSYVPDLFCNAEWTATSVNDVQAAYDQGKALTSFIEIVSGFTISGTNMHITTNILPWDSIGIVRVHNIVIEKTTTGNVGGNGETVFNNVMMDMVPDASGTEVDLQFGTPVQLQFDIDLSLTFVEEYYDLLVAVLVQDELSKAMIQSEYGKLGYSYSSEARLNMIWLDGTPMEGFDPDIDEYNVILPEGTLNPPYVSASTIDENAMAVISHAFQLPGTAIVNVYAEDRFNTNKYLIHFDVYTGIKDKIMPLVQIYPNPVSGVLNIYGLKDATVRIYSSSGCEKLAFTHFSGNPIDLSSFVPGIYLVSITTKDGLIAWKKIIVF